MWLGIGVKIVNWWRRAANGPFSNHATLANGLVSYWKLDELSGVRYDSVTASANDLTDNNTVTYVNAGPSSTVAQFTAANEEYLSNAGTLAVADATVSFAGWVRVTDRSVRRAIICDAVGNFYFALSASDAYPTLFTRSYLDSLADSAHPISDSNWHFLVAYHDAVADQLGASLDGSAFTTSSTGAANGAIATYQLGVRIPVVLPEAMQGNISRAGFWTRKLSVSDAIALYNSGNGKSYSDLTTAEKVGLVSYWNLDEASGNRADSHGSNTLTDNNTVTSVTNSVPPPKNIAAQFTAANLESLTHVDNASLRVGTSDFTFAFWYQRTLDPAAVTSPLAKGSQEEYTFDTNPNAFLGMRFYTKNGGGYPTADWGSALTLNQWYLVIGWRDGTAQTVNIQISNGTPISAATGAIVSADNTGIFALGKLGGGGNYITGLLDEVGFWSRVLTAQERTDLYNAGAGLFY